MNTIYTIQSTGTMCGVHLTGLVFAPRCRPHFFVIPGQLNVCHPGLLESNYIVPGQYPNLQNVAPYAIATTFDGICIPSGFHLTVYSAPNFSGEILLDQEGPAIINNNLYGYSKHKFNLDNLGNVEWLNPSGTGTLTYDLIDLLWEIEDNNGSELSIQYPPSSRYRFPPVAKILNSEEDKDPKENMHMWQNGSMIVTTSLPPIECGPEIPADQPYESYDLDCCFSDVSTIQVNFLP